ncbi:MAG: ROK family protein [Ardenticatenaceae bacterium]|nr:ROK family protein [Ardenticatenaceae bacterium]MCB9445035.1 ROK family protein [Ardenticatenaceae bacterium]
MTQQQNLLQIVPKHVPPLDPGFRPMVLGNRSYRRAVAQAEQTATVTIGIERNAGLVHRAELAIFAPGSGHDEESYTYVERMLKFLLWSRGGWKLYLAGPDAITKRIKAAYQPGGARAFDADLMSQAYGRSFEVVICEAGQIPAAQESGSALGGHLEGCRIGFDLGASDYKLAAVVDGEPVFSTEIPWDPTVQADPNYHKQRIWDGLKLAAAKMPRLDAIGGSSAGIWVDNQPMVASLFRTVIKENPDQFKDVIQPMFIQFGQEMGVPLEVINDGDVTALAGALSLETHGMLGIAMGSSEAVGFLSKEGVIMGWLNELAFAPVDYNPDAPPDEWSGDRGVGALYFSQQAVNKLAPAAGYQFPASMGLPTRLKAVQAAADMDDAATLQIFESIGIYLGYAIANYADFYDFDHLLILGRVTSGHGGELILVKANEVLQDELPELAARIELHVPDEKSRRVGQAVAAASLPR